MKRSQGFHGVKEQIPCSYCQKNLLIFPEKALLGIVKNTQRGIISDLFFACNDGCQHMIEESYEDMGYKVEYEMLRLLMIPSNYLSWMIGNFDVIRNKYGAYEDEAYQKLRELFVTIAPYVMREPTLTEFKLQKQLLNK